MFFILTKINFGMIIIICIVFPCDDKHDFWDSGLWQALAKVTLDLYIYNFHVALLSLCWSKTLIHDMYT